MDQISMECIREFEFADAFQYSINPFSWHSKFNEFLVTSFVLICSILVKGFDFVLILTPSSYHFFYAKIEHQKKHYCKIRNVETRT